MNIEVEMLYQNAPLIRPEKVESGYRFCYIEPSSGDELGPYQGDSEVLIPVMDFAYNFLAQPNESLGRSGAVCPYIGRSLDQNRFMLAVTNSRGEDKGNDLDLIRKYKLIFQSVEPIDGRLALFRTILILFPKVEPDQAHEVIDILQRELKPEFIADGLMIGEFHPMCQTPGIYNQDFKPLQSPIPLIAIRKMVQGDIRFLEGNDEYLAFHQQYFG